MYITHAYLHICMYRYKSTNTYKYKTKPTNRRHTYTTGTYRHTHTHTHSHTLLYILTTIDNDKFVEFFLDSSFFLQNKWEYFGLFLDFLVSHKPKEKITTKKKKENFLFSYYSCFGRWLVITFLNVFDAHHVTFSIVSLARYAPLDLLLCIEFEMKWTKS